MSITESSPRTDITDLILAEHDEFRVRFTKLWAMRGEQHLAARAVACRVLAGRVASGTDSWWAAVQACRRANDEHLAEEKRDVIPDMRAHTEADVRSALGLRWLAFLAEHRAAQGISKADVDPDEFVRENS